MRAVKWEGKPFNIPVNRSKIQHPLDAVMRLTTAEICGTDVYIFHGRLTAKPRLTLGHEMINVIDEVAVGVTALRAGDRVIGYDDTSCGFCDNCIRGLRATCLTVNPPFEGDYFSILFKGVKLNGGQGKPICLCFKKSLTYHSSQQHNMFPYPMQLRQRYCFHLRLITSSTISFYATLDSQLEPCLDFADFQLEDNCGCFWSWCDVHSLGLRRSQQSHRCIT